MSGLKTGHATDMIYLIVLGKTALGFTLLFILTRFLGKRQVSHLTHFDYITGITIGSLAANMVVPHQPAGPLLTAIAFWGTVTYLFHWLGLQGHSVQRGLNGAPTILVQHGQILEKNLRKNKVSLAELWSLLRSKGYFHLDEVEFALLETNGQLSVLPRSQYRPLQPRDLGLSTAYEGLTTQVLHEGTPMADGLSSIGLSEEWLQRELAEQGVTDPSEVFAAWIGTDGALKIDRYRDGPF